MYYLGIDLGGTNIAVGVVDEDGKITARASRRTRVPAEPEDVAAQLSGAALDALKSAGLSPEDVPWVGVGSPGNVDRSAGVVEFAGNLSFHNLPLQRLLEDRLHRPVILENDANAAAYGEYQAGALKGARDAVAITLGTGIGSGILVDGKILSGCNSSAGEMGHCVIVYGGEPCTCGRRGCWEAYASASALIRQTRRALLDAPGDSALRTLTGNDPEKVSGRTAFDAMRAGDPAGKRVVDAYIAYLACGVSNVVNTFQPDILCIGGGICNEGETLLAPLRRLVEQERFTRYSRVQTKLCRAQLGNDAGIIGAAFLGK